MEFCKGKNRHWTFGVTLDKCIFGVWVWKWYAVLNWEK